VVQIFNRILVSPRDEWNLVTCGNTDGTEDHYIKWYVPGTETQVMHDFTLVDSKK
jgi:hypothetical protein